jgi:hypothetical protein
MRSISEEESNRERSCRGSRLTVPKAIKQLSTGFRLRFTPFRRVGNAITRQLGKDLGSDLSPMGLRHAQFVALAARAITGRQTGTDQVRLLQKKAIHNIFKETRLA